MFLDKYFSVVSFPISCLFTVLFFCQNLLLFFFASSVTLCFNLQRYVKNSLFPNFFTFFQIFPPFLDVFFLFLLFSSAKIYLFHYFSVVLVSDLALLCLFWLVLVQYFPLCDYLACEKSVRISKVPVMSSQESHVAYHLTYCWFLSVFAYILLFRFSLIFSAVVLLSSPSRLLVFFE